ncbi:GLPGLI family protein [Leeuwenhoekiella parthenopeia]|uniref:GLPGLI family protein n=1 Tax=Leeuwenhoekiella parthenopeia TaxID=2890320 RepID=A0ABS8GVX8_9FLAO|nr:GLPGLI family protein [Leeuwenhoekiella parthenopeia]MCC4214175.1 GLPGLI family protein [Leeuwenhoekiella parthenopeia]
MIKKIVLILVVFFIPCDFLAQAGNAYYGKQLPSASNENITIEDNAFNQNISNNVTSLEYRLKFNSNKALYTKNKSLNKDTDPVTQAIVEGVANFSGIVYYDRLSNSIIHQKEFAGDTYLVTRNNIDWVLTKESQKIDDFVCYKAVSNRIIKNSEGTFKLQVIAWYSPEIPVPFGPDGYGGLPGLILQLQNNGITTFLKRIIFSDNKEINILKPSKGIKMSENEYEEIVAEVYKNRKN